MKRWLEVLLDFVVIVLAGVIVVYVLFVLFIFALALT